MQGIPKTEREWVGAEDIKASDLIGGQRHV